MYGFIPRCRFQTRIQTQIQTRTRSRTHSRIRIQTLTYFLAQIMIAFYHQILLPLQFFSHPSFLLIFLIFLLISQLASLLVFQQLSQLAFRQLSLLASQQLSPPSYHQSYLQAHLLQIHFRFLTPLRIRIQTPPRSLTLLLRTRKQTLLPPLPLLLLLQPYYQI